MSVRVAIIGAGVMGGDHAQILANDVPGATLGVICDANTERARSIGAATGCANITSDPMATIARADVDAILIASPDETHEALTIAAIQAGKPVLCEKPLAPTADACLRVIAAEVTHGAQLVQTGFMRRFDPGYAQMKSTQDSGRLGPALMMHNFHRNVAAPDWFTGQMAISNSAPHEFDIARFILGAEYASITAFQGTTVGAGEAIAPVVMVLETADGQLVNIEVNNNAAYGYDVRSELVGQTGTVDLGRPAEVTINAALQSASAYAQDWRPRFAEAYRLQNKAWIQGIHTGRLHPHAADAWDGYCATVTAQAGVSSLESNSRVKIQLAEMPQLYADRHDNNPWEGAAE